MRRRNSFDFSEHVEPDTLEMKQKELLQIALTFYK